MAVPVPGPHETERDRVERDRAEHRWPAVAAIVAAIALNALLPQTFTVVPAWVLPALGIGALAPLIFLNPHRLTRDTSWSRWLSIGFTIVLTGVNQVYIVLIIRELVEGSGTGASILLTALQVWITNAIAFALVYWEIDRGGPVARRKEIEGDGPPADFRFPQEEDGTTRWQPAFVDYAYFSLTNMMAFSPTDVMPLSHRAKLLMAYQAVTAFVILAMVISRAVNILT